MGFMKPRAEYMKMYHVDTSMGIQLVPHEVVGHIENLNEIDPDDLYNDYFEDYLEGKEIYSVELKEGWYSQLSANGYMDCTSYQGPYTTSEEAMKEVMDQYEVDEDGD